MEFGAFADCTGLASVTLSQNLTAIKGATFMGCTSLTSIIIPESVSVINALYTWGYGAFDGCANLSKILIPDSVSSIDKKVFQDCSKLTIYGNDGQASKQYAEENNINFDYIANWDKAVAGDDITPPTIKSLEIAYGSAFELDSGTGYYLVSAGTNISIKATFEEIIYGKTAPTLTIKCGNGSNIELANGTIQGSYIIYTYTIKEHDIGIITAVSMTGGDIKDEAGNSAEKYTCTELVTDIWEKYVYANGTKSNPTDQGNNNQSSTVTLSSISITKTPTRNTYSEGESFDKSGMVITATYSDGSKKEITNYTVSPSGALKSTDTKVYITYTENGVTKAVEQKVTVTPKLVINDSNNDSEDSNYDDTQKDTTIKNDSKLPQTGATLITVTIISLIVVAVISKAKCIKYKDI